MNLALISKKRNVMSQKIDRNEILTKLKTKTYLKEVLRQKGIVIILLDVSGSMACGEKISQAKEGVSKFIGEALETGYLVELITFSSNVNLICDRENVSDIKNKMREVVADGTTHMAEAVEFATKRLSEDQGQKVILLATDGEANSPSATLRAANEAKENGIDIIAIGTDDADHGFLKQLSSCEKLAEKVDQRDFGRTIALSMKKLKALPAPN